jgi:hypothetical protein
VYDFTESYLDCDFIPVDCNKRISTVEVNFKYDLNKISYGQPWNPKIILSNVEKSRNGIILFFVETQSNATLKFFVNNKNEITDIHPGAF